MGLQTAVGSVKSSGDGLQAPLQSTGLSGKGKMKSPGRKGIFSRGMGMRIMKEAHSVRQGSVVTVWRYPVKSMMGEQLNDSSVTERGLAGDRAYALVDIETGKVVSAKNPRKWGNLFEFRAAFV